MTKKYLIVSAAGRLHVFNTETELPQFMEKVAQHNRTKSGKLDNEVKRKLNAISEGRLEVVIPTINGECYHAVYIGDVCVYHGHGS